jgi:hypothetical protein
MAKAAGNGYSLLSKATAPILDSTVKKGHAGGVEKGRGFNS